MYGPNRTAIPRPYANQTPWERSGGVWEGKKSERYPTAEGERGMGGQEEQVIPCIK